MITWLSSIVTATLLVGSLAVERRSTRKTAQKLAIALTLCTLSLTLVSAALLPVPEGNLGNWLASGRHILVAAACNGLVGLIAVALTPLTSHSQRSFATILRLIAVGNLFLTVQHPWVLAVCWALSVAFTYSELTQHPETKSVAKLFLFYQLPSTIAFGV